MRRRTAAHRDIPDLRLSPEAELILACARTDIDAAGATRIRALLQQDLNWIILIVTALGHGVLPLLTRSLDRIAPDAVPPGTMRDLRDEFAVHTRRNQALTQELLRLLQRFQAWQIPVVPFKGPALAARAYGDVALREFCDLDLLIRERDARRAEALLLAGGYRPKGQPAAPGTPLDGCEAGYSNDLGTIVELRWRMIAPVKMPFALGPDQIVGRLEPMSLAGTVIDCLAPDDLLLVLCLHGAKHDWRRLLWICDVAQVVRSSPGLDWEGLRRRARALGCERMLFLGLRLAIDLLDMPVPERLRRRLQSDPRLTALSARLRGRLFAEREEPLTAGERCCFFLEIRERWRDRLPAYRTLIYLANTSAPGECARLPLPPGLVPVCALLRRLRWLRGYRQYLRRVRHG